MTYIVRPKKIVLHPNITGKIILDHYKDNEYINGNISFNFIEHPNKVSKIIILIINIRRVENIQILNEIKIYYFVLYYKTLLKN